MRYQFIAVLALSVLSQYSWFSHPFSEFEAIEQDLASLSIAAPAVADSD